MAETKETPAPAKQPQTVEKKPQAKQANTAQQKPPSQEKTGQIAAKEEKTGQIAAKEEKTGQIEATEEKAPEEKGPEVVGHFGAEEEKDVKAKRIDYTPLDWGQADNISDFIVDMMSGNLADWFVSNMKFAGQYVDIAVERANDLSKKMEEDKRLMQTEKEDKSKDGKETKDNDGKDGKETKANEAKDGKETKANDGKDGKETKANNGKTGKTKGGKVERAHMEKINQNPKKLTKKEIGQKLPRKSKV